MSTLWTPGGERPVNRTPSPPSEPAQPSEEEMLQEMAEMQRELLRTPAEVIVANHAYGLFQLARLHLSAEPPLLEPARLAIDALGLLVEGLGDRLGEPAGDLGTGLANLRMAYVQIQGAIRAGADMAPPRDATEGVDGGHGPDGPAS